jgi:hypothetical protein
VGFAETHRSIVFAVALTILIAGFAATALLDQSHLPSTSATAPVAGRIASSEAGGRSAPRGRETQDAAISAIRFVRAYLRYENGELRGADRASLARYSTSEFGGQLLRAPVRIPPGSRPPRQIVARVAAVQAGLSEGRPALLISLVVTGSSGTHLLRATVVRQIAGWAVAGIGP